MKPFDVEAGSRGTVEQTHMEDLQKPSPQTQFHFGDENLLIAVPTRLQVMKPQGFLINAPEMQLQV